jgi:hypothetical protein
MKVNSVLPFLFLGVAGHASMAVAQSPNTFTATGDMSTPRIGHTATLLTNGKVLIAGGARDRSSNDNYLPVASAELYDPSSGTFTATGSMTASRVGHTATLLPNGKVLIAGGAGDISPDGGYLPVASAELYDPSSGTFTATGDMIAHGLGTRHPPDDGFDRRGPLDHGHYFPPEANFTILNRTSRYRNLDTVITGPRHLARGRSSLDRRGSAHLYDPGTGGSATLSTITISVFTSTKGDLAHERQGAVCRVDDDEGDFGAGIV